MKTLKLFNAVIAKGTTKKPFVSEDGFIIVPEALWAKDRILNYYKQEKLNGNDLNKTFHKSWKKIKNSSRYELFIEQILHYISTYSTNFQSEMYIPDEVIDIPDLKLVYKVINAYTKKELIEKCLSLLQQGIALKEETINDILTILVDELDYSFDGSEKINNKEAIIKIADLYNVFPQDIMEFFRYIIYKATGESLLIKSNDLITLIKNTNFNPTIQFKQFGLERLAEIFNRFKPLFLAFKDKCPSTINRISKLSKQYHKPLTTNPLNQVTSILLNKNDNHWLDNATPFALFKALSACYARMDGQDTFLYKIRNGKSWVKEDTEININLNMKNYIYLIDYIKNRFDLSNIKVFLPENIQYAVPTSEKMFIGNIPTGTKFYGDKLAVGIYWKNSWGANDLDLSGITKSNVKIGWNARYNENDVLFYSGDITNAIEGAVEYLYADKKLDEEAIIYNNIYSGDSDCNYKIVIGKGDDINKQYMIDPNKLFAEVKCESVQRQTILGIFLPKIDKQCFVMLNIGSGNIRVSEYDKISKIAIKALIQQWSNPISFKYLLIKLGAKIVDEPEDADIDYSLDALEKDSFTKPFR